MSYLVLARKSRPQTFDQVIGQASIVKTLKNSLQRNRVAHAILFSGVRGVGKTTLARIMAKAINCEQPNDNPPCNECETCKEITAGSSLDLHEIDGASNRGIQEIRELKEKARFLPSSAKYRIIIIDEVHMLTTEAFNALLKILEEPPEHVYFMFATTELHKIPVTILSRCQQYELKRISADDLANHFSKLVKEEGKTIEPEALSLIVREAAGSVRDGLSLLDQALSFGEEKITSKDVVEVLGLIDRDVLLNLTKALLDANSSEAFLLLDQIFKFGMDIKRFCIDLIQQFRTLILTKIEGCQSLIDLPEQEFQTFKNLAAQYSTQSLHMKMNMLIEMVEYVSQSSQPRLILETTFLKIIEADQVIPAADLLRKLDTVIEQGSFAAGAKQTSPPAEINKPVITSNPPEQTAATPKPEKTPEPVAVPPEPPAPPAPPVEENPPPPEEKKSKKKDINSQWQNFLGYLQETAPWLAPSVLHASKMVVVDKQISLYFDDEIHCTLLKQKKGRTELQQFMLDFFHQDLRVKVHLPEKIAGEQGCSIEKLKAAGKDLSNHPLVIATTEIFRGHVTAVRPKKQQ